MERLLKNQQIPLVQVIDPISGQQYYSPESAIYTTSTDSNPVILKNVTVDQATSASYVSGSADRAISASYALTASYAFQALSASFASTASYVNPLNQSVTIGNITSIPSTENSLNIYPPPAGGTGEGGQILLAASGGLYTSASMIDTWQNTFRLLKGTNTGGSTVSYINVDLNQGNTTFAGYVQRSVPVPSPYIFQGILAGNQSIPDSTDTRIDFVDQFDPQNWWDPTAKTFTPTISGYYQISFGVWLDNPGTTTGQANAQCRKNGTTQIIVQYPLNNQTGQSLAGSKIIQMNGRTDYVDVTIYHNAGSAKNILQGNANGSGTWFTATLLGL